MVMARKMSMEAILEVVDCKAESVFSSRGLGVVRVLVRSITNKQVLHKDRVRIVYAKNNINFDNVTDYLVLNGYNAAWKLIPATGQSAILVADPWV